MKRVLDYIKSLNIDKNEHIIVACSGGPDSMFLLHLLNDLGYNCVCAHVNHKMRIESDSEYDFVHNYCDINNIIFEGIELTSFENGNFEKYAREFRYNFFEELINKYNAKYLFTAHHGDDLIETVLMRLVRGSSLKGYRGFDVFVKKKNYNIVRPLVFLTKNVIIEYLNNNKIKYVIDSSNDKDDYTRNRYRHHVLPFLKEEDKDVHLRFLKYNETLNEAYEYITRNVLEFMKDNYIDGTLNLNEFKKCDSYLKIKVLEEIFRGIFIDDLYLISRNHVDTVLDIINSDKVNISVNLVDDLTIVKSYDKLSFIIDDKDTEDYRLLLDEIIELDDGIIRLLSNSDDTSNYVIRLNSKDVKLPLYVRNRKNGDRISVKNLDGTKKVNDIFIDCKIDMKSRNRWPLLVDSADEVLWVPGLKKSNLDVPFNGVYDIIVGYEKRR